MLSPRRCAFFDRDGVINRDYGYVYKKEEFVFNDGIFELLEFLKSHGFLLIVVTNQSGIARGYYTQQDLEVLHTFMQECLKERLGFGFDKIYFCPHAPQEQCTCRKPQSGMITRACKDFAIDLAHSEDLLDCNVQSVQSLAQIQNLLAQSVARSGVSGDSLSMSDTQILQKQNLH